MSTPTAPRWPEAFAALHALLGDRFTTNRSVREMHGQGEAFHSPHWPDAVAFAQSTEEVQAIVRICASHGMPLIPYGAGTSLEGGITAPQGGLSLDLTQMNRILAVNDSDLDCVVEAGVTREQLNTHLKDRGLFFSVDPGADATIGGMAATRASGTNTVRYGSMRDLVLFLRVVLPDGTAVRTGGRARKSAAGYDLTRLFIGSEGTLGIITEVGIRLFGIPEQIAAAVCTFPSLDAAVATAMLAVQLGLPVARVELLDDVQIGACNAYSGTSLTVAPTLFFEFHGTAAGVAETAGIVADIAAENGGGDFTWATKAEDRSQLWKARHQAYFAAMALRPGTRLLVSDVCVPISHLAECIAAAQADILAAGLVAPILGHVGDGNFHVFYSVDPGNDVEVANVRALNDRLVERALALDGTCTGEHGIGLGKRHKLLAERGPDAVGLMRRIKAAIDPTGLFNPGKIFLD